jgi:hypothetical protein
MLKIILNIDGWKTKKKAYFSQYKMTKTIKDLLPQKCLHQCFV